MAEIAELRIGPTEDKRGQDLAIQEIVTKLNELVQQVNDLSALLNT